MMKYLNIFFLITFFGIMLLAAPTENIKSKLDKKEDSKGPWSLSSSYAFKFNATEQSETKIYHHDIILNGTYNHRDLINLGLSLDLNYESVGSNIDSRQYQNDHIDGIGLELNVSKKIMESNDIKINIFGGLSFPNDTGSRLNGIKSIPTLGSSLSYKYNTFYTVSNSLSAHYIFNRYRYSPLSPFEIQKESGLSYSLTNAFTISKNLAFRLKASARVSRYLDNTNVFSGNSLSGILSYTQGPLSANLSYSSGTHADKDEWDTWYIDEFRQIIGLGVSYAF